MQEHGQRRFQHHLVEPFGTTFQVGQIKPDAHQTKEDDPSAPVPSACPASDSSTEQQEQRGAHKRDDEAQRTLGKDGKENVQAEAPLQVLAFLDVLRKAIGALVHDESPEGIERSHNPQREQHVGTHEERHSQLHAAGEEHDRSQHSRLAAVLQPETLRIVFLHPSVHDGKDYDRRDEREQQRDGDHEVMAKHQLQQRNEPDVERHDVGKLLALPRQAEQVVPVDQFSSQAHIAQLGCWREVSQQHHRQQRQQVGPIFFQIFLHK